MTNRRHDAPTFGVWLGLPVLSALSLAVALRQLYPMDLAARWTVHPAVVAGLCWGGQLWYVGHGLDARHLGSRELFGVANAVTLIRGGLYTVVAGFVVLPPDTSLAWVPALCYGTGVVLDKLDGVLARTVGTKTELGTRLDMAFDTFGFVVAPLVAVLWGQLPVWYLSLSAARYVYRGGLWWRRRQGRAVFDLPDGSLATYLAGAQMVFITVALAPASPTGIVRLLAPVVLAPSLVVFGRDYLVASGRLPRQSPAEA